MYMLNGWTKNKNTVKVLFLVLLLAIALLFLFLTQYMFNPVTERRPPPFAKSTQVRKDTLTKTATSNRNSYIQGDRRILSDYHRTVTNTNPNRKEQLYNKHTTEADVSTTSTQQIPTPRNSREVTHIEFLKVHKAASSTVQSIILRFGLKRNLSIVIPTPVHYISHQKYYFSDLWPPLPKPYNKIGIADDNSNKYDILSNHMIFNRKKVSQLST